MSDGADVEPLAALAALADELGAADAAHEARALAARLAAGRYYVAAVGQFKRGKSTVLNALVGEALLPTGIAPVTSVITIIRSGAARRVDVAFKDGRRATVAVEELPLFVAEADNPQNTKGIAAVEVFHPAPLLHDGLCLVDTPGLGSVLAANTAETRAFVPHIDAALVVLGADPPIAADEAALVDEIARDVDQLIFVVNKADRVTAAQLAEAREFTLRVLRERLPGAADELFEISAAERLGNGATRDWTALERRLRDLASDAGEIVSAAARRGADRTAARLARDVANLRQAIGRTVEESERHIAGLSASVDRAAVLLDDLGALMREEERRVIDRLESMHQPFVARATPELEPAIRGIVRALAATSRGTALRRTAFDAAADLVSSRLRAWAAEMEPHVEALYRRAADRFLLMTGDFLHSLKASGDRAFDDLPDALEPESGLRAPRHFYFTELMYLTAAGPTDWLLDKARRRSTQARAVSRDAAKYAARLLMTNSSRIVFDLRDRVGESRQRLEAELRALLNEITASAARALDRARRVRDQGAAAVAAELARLERMETLIEDSRPRGV